ncbi:hypothetical protein [Pseudobacteriovorax antillogorgiicola]|uniref:DoxX protein n=1 Tax=Pseudobacteriovorax antillogorgiicola TaxID=1513793 RepID=A0A1Y6BZ91_9BACT|nr:hypothetical protein [Pseudobacteriovorax antillogorgiicola]TCS52443.1 hypothetical protein EDD56_109188 [Pseudobacteriovorax antillogorgiicola]SMF28605.1 hypothetical protein SAMN06296036_10925 [Pseudobacteriovorax antillogorgiicola]
MEVRTYEGLFFDDLPICRGRVFFLGMLKTLSSEKWAGGVMLAQKLIVRLIVLLQCLGLGAIAILDGTAVGTYLFLYTGLEEVFSYALNYAIAIVLLGVAMATLKEVRAWPLLVMGFVFITEAFFKTVLGGQFASNLTLGAHMVRYMWPLLLGLSLSFDSTGQSLKRRDVLFFLRLAISGTFVVHGVEALMMHPKFIDFIIVANTKFPWLPATEGFARNALIAIGLIDIVVAMLVMMRPSLWSLGYMAIWGALTAGARVIFADIQGIPDMILRAPHWGIPLLLMVLMWKRRPQKRATDQAKGEQVSAAPS